MKCPNKNCNAENPQGSKFCSQCGTKLEVSKKCPNPDCGTDNLPAMAKFCPDCGIPLEKENKPDVEQEDEATSSSLYDGPIEMVLVEGGTFEMGSEEGDTDESPVHDVTLKSFYIGKYPVKQAEWVEIMGENPSLEEGDEMPVTNVSWYDCVEFCNQLNEENGYEACYEIDGEEVKWLRNKRGFRLPTEAEWEFAARGGNESIGWEYAGSDDAEDVAWFDDNSENELQDVGLLEPNELDIYDMSGNVDEWCWDWYDDYPDKKKNNPLGPRSGSYRVNRGGSWCFSADYCRVAHRSSDAPTDGSFNLGFRLVFVF